MYFINDRWDQADSLREQMEALRDLKRRQTHEYLAMAAAKREELRQVHRETAQEQEAAMKRQGEEQRRKMKAMQDAIAASKAAAGRLGSRPPELKDDTARRSGDGRELISASSCESPLVVPAHVPSDSATSASTTEGVAPAGGCRRPAKGAGSPGSRPETLLSVDCRSTDARPLLLLTGQALGHHHPRLLRARVAHPDAPAV